MQRRDLHGARERHRNRMLDLVPPRYRRWKRVCINAAICKGVALVAVAFMDIASRWQLLAVIPMLAFLNVFEWGFHRFIMHHKTRMPSVYRTHTIQHHAMYWAERMGDDDQRGSYYILMAGTTIGGFMGMAAIVSLLTGLLFGQPYGWMMLATGAAYIMGYEALHAAYHTPDGHWIKRFSIVRMLSALHTRHHEPRLMSRWNFNITVPFADWMFGTLADKRIADVMMRTHRDTKDANVNGGHQ